jgi:PadR family transcriptional regulator PadR
MPGLPADSVGDFVADEPGKWSSIEKSVSSCGIRTGVVPYSEVTHVAAAHEPYGSRIVTDAKLDLLQGTLDLMVLQTLMVMGEMHGYGIARRIEQISGEAVLLNQGTIYAALVRLQHQGWISAEWGISENNRKAKFYAITRAGKRQLAKDAAYWQRLSELMGRVLTMEAEESEG